MHYFFITPSIKKGKYFNNSYLYLWKEGKEEIKKKHGNKANFLMIQMLEVEFYFIFFLIRKVIIMLIKSTQLS